MASQSKDPPAGTYDVRQLQTLSRSGVPQTYLFFYEERPVADGSVDVSCLNQWFPAPFVVDDHSYPTAEHFMMAEKARLFGDEPMRLRIQQAKSPFSAHLLGRQIQGFVETVWAGVREDIVFRGNLAKFGQHPKLAAYLRSTSPRILAYASPGDWTWGIGLAQEESQAQEPLHWPGHNLLGFTLMRVRSAL